MSNSISIKASLKPQISIKAQTLAAAGAIIGAVALPQLFHFIGKMSGVGTALGEIFLPMHLPIILAGLLAGPYVGIISGLLAPLVSFAISGMPSAAMLPFMMVELAFYGFSAGLLSASKFPSIVKVVISQLVGRAAKTVAVAFAVYTLGNSALSISSIWLAITKGFPGLLLQWILIPLIVYWVEKVSGKGKNINE